MINYNQLKQDEKEIINRFKQFLNHVMHFYEETFNEFIHNKNCELAFYESIDIDKKNIGFCRDILDDCIWFIQRNEPRANHLRLIVAIINSLNDIKRISSYTVTLSKYYYKRINDIDEQTVKVIAEIGTLTIKSSHSLCNIIEQFDFVDMKKKANKIFDDYIEKYKKMFYDSIHSTLETSKKTNTKFIANLVVVLKNFDRTIDHLMNIIENISNIS